METTIHEGVMHIEKTRMWSSKVYDVARCVW